MNEQPRRSSAPRLRAFGSAAALFALVLTGCYRSHDGPGPDGGRCGDTTCAPGQRCCVFGCAGRGRCLAPGSPCPPYGDAPIGSCCTTSAECAFAVCRFPMGSCGESGTGVCAEDSPRPSCEGECAHVCGCDGRTYCNECEAIDAGTLLAHEGPCECGPGRGEGCRRGQYCLHAPGACGDDGVPGACVDRPTCPGMGRGDECACPYEHEDRVCSCDGRMDPSAACAAARAQSLATPDRCWEREPALLCRALCDLFVDTCGLAMPTGCVRGCLDALDSCTGDDAARAWACIEPGDCALAAPCMAELACASGWPGTP